MALRAKRGHQVPPRCTPLPKDSDVQPQGGVRLTATIDLSIVPQLSTKSRGGETFFRWVYRANCRPRLRDELEVLNGGVPQSRSVRRVDATHHRPSSIARWCSRSRVGNGRSRWRLRGTQRRCPHPL